MGENMIFNSKKIIILLISLFLLTGCTVNYELLIVNNNITESIYVSNNNIILNQNILSTIKDDYGVYYNIEYNGDPPHCDSEECVNEVEPVYNYNSFSASAVYYGFDNYQRSKVIDDFFGNFKVSQNNTVYFLTATPNTNLQSVLNDVNYIKAPVDEIVINIVIPNKVIENNADQVNGNTYTWIYNKDTANKVLTISYDTSVSFSNNNSGDSDLESGIDIDNNNNNSDNNLNIKDDGINYFLVIGTLVVVILISVFIYFKMKKNDNL